MIVANKVSKTLPIAFQIQQIPAPPQPKFEVKGSTVEVNWEKQSHVTGYSLRHLGESTNKTWQEISEDGFTFQDASSISHSIDMFGEDSHIIQIRAHFGDFRSEWTSLSSVTAAV